MLDHSTSLSLLQRARDRNQEAWERIVYLYGPLVDHWCRSWGVQAADVDDIRQEVFKSVTGSLDSFRHNRPGDTFRGWLWVIARRKYLDHHRQRQRQPNAHGGSDANLLMQQVPEPPETPAEDPPEEVTGLHHRALELIRSHFEERSWLAFWRTVVERQSPVEVGQQMGMTPAAVRQAKSRILRFLKSEFGELLS